MTRTSHAALLSAGLLLTTAASGVAITFEDLAPGVTLSTQYASQGVVFSPNAFSGSGSSSSGSDWATNTDMTIVSIDTGTLGLDYGALGVPSLVINNIVHRFENWQYLEDGDPSFDIDFTVPVSSVSVTFAGIDGAAHAADTRIFVYSGGALLGIVAGSLPDDKVGQLKLNFAAPNITRVAVVPGSFDDWVGVDLLEFVPSPVPEPETWALMLLGLAGGSWARRRLQP
jgi:hypothetical protein